MGIYYVPLVCSGFSQQDTQARDQRVEDSGERMYSLSPPTGCGSELAALLRFGHLLSCELQPSVQALAASGVVGISSSPLLVCAMVFIVVSDCCLHWDVSLFFAGVYELCPYRRECCCYFQSSL